MSMITHSFHDTRVASGRRTFGRMAGVAAMAAATWVGVIAGVAALV